MLVDAWPTLSSRGVGFLTSNVSSFPDKAGVRQGIIGSIILIVFVALLAVPIGVAAAIYLQEYARDTRANRLLITNIRNLAGVPAIVYGILGVVIFVQAMQSITGPKVHGRSIIAGGLTLSVLVMPFVIIITMEALRAVPNGIRDAAYGVGATRWEVVRSHVLPYAAPGVFTGVILAIARAFGETAPLLLVGAVTGIPRRRESKASWRRSRGSTRPCRRSSTPGRGCRRTCGGPTRPPRSWCCSAPSSS